MNNVMNICFISDNGYVKYLETIIISILLNSDKDDNFHFHVIEDNISDNYKDEILELKKIKDFQISYYKSLNIEKYKEWTKYFKSLLGMKYLWSYQIYLKLDILTLFDNIDRILFLDADQVVLTRLNKFFEIDMNNNYLYFSPYPIKESHVLLDSLGFKEFLLSIEMTPPEQYAVLAGMLLFNLKSIRDNFNSKEIENKINDCFKNYKNILTTEEKMLPYIFRKKCVAVDYNLEIIENNHWNYSIWNDSPIKLLHYNGSRLNQYLSYDYNKDIDHAYVSFWEYFCQTPYYKNNYVEYSNIHMAHLRRWLLQERELRKWHIEDSRKYSKDNYNKLLNMILWIIPFKSIRNKLRNKYID